MRLNSMRARVTLAFACAIAALMLFVCGWLVWYTRRAAENNAQLMLHNADQKIRDEFKEEYENQEERGSPLDLPKFIREKSPMLQSDGLVMFSEDANGHEAAKPPHSVAEWRTVRIPAGADSLVIALFWQKQEQALREQALELFYLSMLVTAAAAAGAWLLVGHTLSPIDTLAAEAQAAAGDSLNVRLNTPSPDAEVVNLVATLNGLMGRLGEASAARGRFYAAASHELRTPLHTLSGHLEVGLSRERTNAEYRETMEEAYLQTRRLTALVQDLLLLTQLQGAPAAPARERVSLTEICDRLLQNYAPVIAARRLHLQTELGGDIAVAAPPTHVEMLTRNLVENAVKYASEGGELALRLSANGAAAELGIFNTCVPLPAGDINQLREPFFRPDESRSSETGGNGLGLAICHTIAVTNHWQLHLSQETDGFRVTVKFADDAPVKEARLSL